MGMHAAHQALASLAILIEGQGLGQCLVKGVDEHTQFFLGRKRVFPRIFMKVSPGSSHPVLVLAENGEFEDSCSRFGPQDECILVLFGKPTHSECKTWLGPQNTEGLYCYKAVEVAEVEDGVIRVRRVRKRKLTTIYYPS